MDQKQSSHQEKAQEFYLAGLEHAHHGEWGRAASCFRKALALDPDSPAKQSLEMVDDIQAYYYKENFNP